MSVERTIKVIVNGAKGKMGAESVKAINQDLDLTLVAALDQGDHLSKEIQANHADVVLDFTHPDSAQKNTLTILENNAFAVIGTTGLSEQGLADIHALASNNELGALVVPNFAIGAVLMMKFAAEASKYLEHGEIIEFHHNNKADAPSGTAIKTAEMMAAANPQLNTTPIDETELIKGARGGSKNNIPIHSVRLPGYVAHQEVIFGGLGQTLSIRHDTINRESFMPGVLLSIKKVLDIRGLVYGLENIL